MSDKINEQFSPFGPMFRSAAHAGTTEEIASDAKTNADNAVAEINAIIDAANNSADATEFTSNLYNTFSGKSNLQ